MISLPVQSLNVIRGSVIDLSTASMKAATVSAFLRLRCPDIACCLIPLIVSTTPTLEPFTSSRSLFQSGESKASFCIQFCEKSTSWKISRLS